MRSRDEKLKILKKLQSSNNISKDLKKLGVSKSTYYKWKSGVGLDYEVESWVEQQDDFLKESLGKGVSKEKISKVLKKTENQIKHRIDSLGLSILQLKIEYRKKHGKKCSVCDKRKPLDEFYNASYESIDGKQSQCKKCFNEIQKVTVSKKPVKYREYGKKRRIEKADSIKSYRVKHRRTAKGHYTSLKASDKESGRNLLRITRDEFVEWYEMQEQVCHYCNITLENYLLVKSSLIKSASTAQNLTIDRKDSLKNYTADNIVFACALCNYVKGYAFNEIQFKEIAKTYIVPVYENLLNEL